MIMSKNCSCLVSMSDHLNENVKAAAMLTAVFDIGDTAVCSGKLLCISHKLKHIFKNLIGNLVSCLDC